MSWLWVGLFSIALLTVVYVYLIEPIRQRQRAWTVRAVKPLALKTWEVTIEPDGHSGLKYEAGQFVWLNIGHSPFSVNENPFSISSAPGSGTALQFVIKELGDFTRTIGSIEPGTLAYLDGPHGNLVVSGRDEPGIALFAGRYWRCAIAWHPAAAQTREGRAPDAAGLWQPCPRPNCIQRRADPNCRAHMRQGSSTL